MLSTAIRPLAPVSPSICTSLPGNAGSVGPTRMSTVVPSEFSEYRTQFNRAVYESFDFHEPQYADYFQPMQAAADSAAALGYTRCSTENARPMLSIELTRDCSIVGISLAES